MPCENDLKREFPKRPNQVLRFSVALPPTQNSAYYSGRRGIKAHAKLWMSRARAEVLKQIEDSKWKHEGEKVWFYIDMVFFFPDRRYRDNHNTFKIGFDGIEGTFNANDYYFMPRVHGCYLDRDNPRLEVLVRAQTEAQCEKYKKGVK